MESKADGHPLTRNLALLRLPGWKPRFQLRRGPATARHFAGRNMRDDQQPGVSRRARWAGGRRLISRLMAEALARPHMVSLAAGFVDQATLPVEATQEALAKLWSSPALAQAALQYGTTIGYLPLREAILARMAAADGAASGKPPSVDQVVVTAGSNQFLHLVADTLLDPGDVVLSAAPSYFVFMGTLANLGADGGRGDRLPGHDPRGPGAGTRSGGRRPGNWPS